jgi:hypothetical protein
LAKLVSGLKQPVTETAKNTKTAITAKPLILLREIDFKIPPILFPDSNSYDNFKHPLQTKTSKES